MEGRVSGFRHERSVEREQRWDSDRDSDAETGPISPKLTHPRIWRFGPQCTLSSLPDLSLPWAPYQDPPPGATC